MQIWYDRRGEILGVRLRRGEPKRVIAGRGTFVIFMDDSGIWGIDLEVAEWDRGIDEVDKALSDAQVEVYGQRS